MKGRGGFKLSPGVLNPKDDYEWIVKGGTYQVLTSEVKGPRVPRIDLTNPGTTSYSISQVAVRSLSSPGGLATSSAATTIQPHGSSQLSVQFLLPKRDFAAWYRGPIQQFVFTLHPAGSKSARLVLPLAQVKE